MRDDDKIIKDFGDEWKESDYQSLNDEKLYENFEQYFSIFPWKSLPKIAKGWIWDVDLAGGLNSWHQELGHLTA